MNEILLRGLEVQAEIGVPDEERQHSQRLLVDVVITPRLDFEKMEDRIENTVDYDAVARRIVGLAAAQPRQLIETLAAEIVEMVLSDFPAEAVQVEIRKFILPNTEYVAVRCARSLRE